MEILEAIILGIVQSITEWLPISSSGHLAILQKIFGFQSLSFDVFLHFASLFAVVFVFRKEIMNLRDLKYILYILIAIIPIAFIGALFRDTIAGFFSSTLYLGIFFILSGLIVYSTKFTKEKRENINAVDSILIGIFQAIAILPGISRSGSTISAGMFRGLKKEEAVKFSFLLSIPVILGASLFEFKGLVVADISYSLLTISFLVTFFTSVLTIKLLLKIIKTEKFYLFGVYNLILGLAILFFG